MRKVDNCCDYKNCKLKQDFACSVERCCENCQVIRFFDEYIECIQPTTIVKNKICRQSFSECDKDDFCKIGSIDVIFIIIEFEFSVGRI